MEVDITSTDTDEVDPVKVYQALTDAGYYVTRVTVRDRRGIPHREYEADD